MVTHCMGCKILVCSNSLIFFTVHCNTTTPGTIWHHHTWWLPILNTLPMHIPTKYTYYGNSDIQSPPIVITELHLVMTPTNPTNSHYYMYLLWCIPHKQETLLTNSIASNSTSDLILPTTIWLYLQHDLVPNQCLSDFNVDTVPMIIPLPTWNSTLLLKCYHAKPEPAKKTHTGAVWLFWLLVT